VEASQGGRSQEVSPAEISHEERRLIFSLIGQAKSTALDGASQVELRLRNAGVPIDQYKKQAGEVAQDLQNRVQEAASYLEQNADKAKKQGECFTLLSARSIDDDSKQCSGGGQEAVYILRFVPQVQADLQ
jgi:hypothetical protein